MKINLVVMSAGSAAGRALPINVAQFLIGRDPQCNLRPASAMISKRHCAVLVKNEQVFLRDLDSTNGTFVNDQQIKGEVPLKDGDLIKVGPLCFKAVIEGVVAKVPETVPPPPRPKTAESADDDAAAALLSVDEEDGSVSVGSAETAQDAVPEGTTIMDMPAFKPGQTVISESPLVAPKPQPAAAAATPPEAAAEAKKPEPPKAKPKTGAAQDAAKALLDKLRAGKRK